jgi:hypothetical protein
MKKLPSTLCAEPGWPTNLGNLLSEFFISVTKNFKGWDIFYAEVQFQALIFFIFRLQLSDSEEELDFMDLTEDDLGKPVRKMPTPATKTEAHSRVPQQLPQKPSSDFIPKVVSGQVFFNSKLCF